MKDNLKAALAPFTAEKQISCRKAHDIALTTGSTPETTGSHLDELKIRINTCQLGLFGYGTQKKNLNPDIEVPDSLSRALQKRVNEGVISCLACWECAESENISRIDIGSACDQLGIKIKPCQLGAF